MSALGSIQLGVLTVLAYHDPTPLSAPDLAYLLLEGGSGAQADVTDVHGSVRRLHARGLVTPKAKVGFRFGASGWAITDAGRQALEEQP